METPRNQSPKLFPGYTCGEIWSHNDFMIWFHKEICIGHVHLWAFTSWIMNY